MAASKKNPFPSSSFGSRLGSMLRLDCKRMLVTPLFWVCLGTAFAIPILVLVMTSMVGSEAGGMIFTNTWQIIGSESGALGMDMTAMMNINLVFFLAAVFICLFTAGDFRSGYTKNLFTVRAKKTDYVASKTILGWLAGVLFLVAFLIGSIAGGTAAGLPFVLGAAGAAGLVMSMLAKSFLMGVFVAIYLVMSVLGKHRAWMSILLSLFGGMLLFLMIPMLTPLDAGVAHVGLCLAGGVIFASALGTVSNLILKTSSLVR